MDEDKTGHIHRVPISRNDRVKAEPQVSCAEEEVGGVIRDLIASVDRGTYIPPSPRKDNPALSEEYVFDTADEKYILKDLKLENFVGKIKDLSKGAVRRMAKGYSQEYLYVFMYACKLSRRESLGSAEKERILIYIKVNNRKEPVKQVIVISFHRNHLENKK